MLSKLWEDLRAEVWKVANGLECTKKDEHDLKEKLRRFCVAELDYENLSVFLKCITRLEKRRALQLQPVCVDYSN